jgi:uncharacterized protein YdeI (YjbR/CyaY-like superfamily)
MINEGRMTAAGLAKIEEAKKNGEWFKPRQVRRELVIPTFIEEALAKNRKAQVNFNKLANSYKRMYVGWISSAKKEETRIRRLVEAVSLLEQNKKLGLK